MKKRNINYNKALARGKTIIENEVKMKTRNIIFLISACFFFSMTLKQNVFAQDKNKKYYEVLDVNPLPIGGVGALISKIEFSDEAKKKNISGTVIIKVFVNETGKVDDAKIVQDIGYGFGEAALREVKNASFKPGELLIDGERKKVNTVINLTLNLSAGFNEDIFFDAVEQVARPIEGTAGIMKNLIYPEMAKRAGIQGRVMISASIDENGKVLKTELLKGIGGGCDEAAQEAVRRTPFQPGMQRGKAVKTRVAIPVVFKLPANNIDDSLYMLGVLDKDAELIGGIESIAEKLKKLKSFFTNEETNVSNPILIYAYINENGEVDKAEIAKGTNSAFEKSIVSAFRSSKFTPGEKDGKKVKVKKLISINLAPEN